MSAVTTVMVCAGGLPGDGATLLACLLGASLYAKARRIRLTTDDDDARDPRSTSIHPHWFRPDERYNVLDARQRRRFRTAIEGASGVVLVDSAATRDGMPPIVDALEGITWGESTRLHLALAMTADLQSLERCRTIAMNLFHLPSAVTAAFNPGASGTVADNKEWSRLWSDSIVASVLAVQKRSSEFWVPECSDRLIDTVVSGGQARGVAQSHQVASLDVARWKRVVATVNQRFSAAESRYGWAPQSQG